MITQQARPQTKSWHIKPLLYGGILFFNVIIFILIGTTYNRYVKAYSQKLFDENINNVENLNEASANAACTYIRSIGVKIDDTLHYIEKNALDYDAALQYICEANTDPDRQFQLVLCGSYGSTGELSFGDYSGVSVRMAVNDEGVLTAQKKAILYGSGYYDIYRAFTDVSDKNLQGLCFTTEFTDPDTKQKCIGVYRHVDLLDASGGRKLYAMLLVIRSQTALTAYNMQNEYVGQSTVLIDSDGNYIIKDSDYRNANFYDYIVNYNGLKLDKKAEIQNLVFAADREKRSSTNLFYKNHRGVDCIFSVAVMDNGWYSVTCVPLSSFNMQSDSVNYSLMIVLLFAVLFVADGLSVYIFGKAMNASVLAAKKAQEEANQANLAKSRFLSTMSHELRTPLNAIIGLTSLSRDSMNDPTVLQDYLKKIDISSKLLLQLISDILDVSAIESNKMKLNNGEFDPTKLITALSVIYYEQCAKKGVEFGVVLKDIHSEQLIGDSVRVNQVLLNFLSNAVKFTPSGGRVTLHAQQQTREDSRTVVRFEVFDTGCGISDEMMTRLFKPFERANGDAARKYSGTGLGLSIAKNLVELMGGTIGVESREGAGSRFYAEIPFDLPKNPGYRSFSPIKNLYLVAAIHNPDERAYIGRILAGFGVQHVLTDSVAEALAVLREKRDGQKPFNLCMLDWKLADLSALDATVKIREEFDRNVLQIVVLAYDLAEAKSQCIESGADYVFGKPLFPSSLYSFLEEITTGHKRVVPDVVRNYDFAGRRILLVEDHEVNLEIAQLLLKKTGAQVDAAVNGKLGYERFAASEPGYYDAILMDVQMPVMNGYDATRAIRACAHPDAKSIPIIAMTADAFSEDVQKAKAAGMNEHLAKPIVPETLYATLKHYFR